MLSATGALADAAFSFAQRAARCRSAILIFCPTPVIAAFDAATIRSSIRLLLSADRAAFVRCRRRPTPVRVGVFAETPAPPPCAIRRPQARMQRLNRGGGKRRAQRQEDFTQPHAGGKMICSSAQRGKVRHRRTPSCLPAGSTPDAAPIFHDFTMLLLFLLMLISRRFISFCPARRYAHHDAIIIFDLFDAANQSRQQTLRCSYFLLASTLPRTRCLFKACVIPAKD